MGDGRSLRAWMARLSLLGQSATLRYGAAILTALVALAIREAVDGVLPAGFPYLTFFPAVILTAFITGRGPGILCAVLCGLFAWYFYIPVFQSFLLDGPSALALAFYAAIVAVDIAVIHAMQVALARLQAERARTAALLATQTTMFHELQHRVANNMQFVSSLLTLQRWSIGDSPHAAAAALEEAGRRLDTMARVHRRLHDPQAGDDFGRHIEALSRDLIQATGVRNILCQVAVEAAPRSPERLLALALLIVEALTNALKHAFEGREGGFVSIELRPDPSRSDGLHLCIIDDGVGLPAGFNLQALPSLGWKIIHSLAGQLNGRLTVGRPRRHPSGTCIDLHFPA